MESTYKEVGEVGEAANAASPSSNHPASGSSKRHKELENAALQTSLNSMRMEEQATSAAGDKPRQEEDEATPGSLPLDPAAAPTPVTAEPEEDAEERGEGKAGEEERSLTDHLNKRLLSSFLEKLNERDLALPGIQRLDCAVAGEEDSNRAVEEW